MLVERCNIPDISSLKLSVAGCYLISCLVGEDEKMSAKMKSYVCVLARLIDKAKNEYNYARETIIEEVKENSLSYDEILARGKGQCLFTCTIINHIENCINALSRIYKILDRITMKKYRKYSKSKKISDVRCLIEHTDEEIFQMNPGSVSLNISKDAQIVEIKNKELKLADIANEIKTLYKIFTDKKKLLDLQKIENIYNTYDKKKDDEIENLVSSLWK